MTHRPAGPRKRLARASVVALAFVLAVPTTALAAGGGGEQPDEDLEPPEVSFTAPAGAANGWYGDTVEVGIRITDNERVLSGAYILSGATTSPVTPWSAGAKVTIANEGLTAIDVDAEDANGNMGSGRLEVGIDRTAPTAGFTGLLTDGAWFAQHSEIELTYGCADAHSGVVSCTVDDPDGFLDTSTIHMGSLTVTATDRVGRQSSTTISYSIVDPNFQTAWAPTVQGAPRVGGELTVGAPGFVPEPQSITYQWRRGGAVIDGATAATYVPTAADLGQALSVTATAHKPGFNEKSETSAPVTVAPGRFEMDGAPALDHEGTLVGTTFVVDHADIRPAEAEVAYRWYRGASLITGATGSSYTTTVADRGHRLRAEVVATLDAYADRVWSTAQSPAITGLPLQATGTPRVTGTARVGSILRTTLPTYSTGDATVKPTATVQWLRNGVPVPGARGTTYRLGIADAGRRITAQVTGNAPGYEPLAITSAPTAAVAKAVPRVTASAKPGRAPVVTVRVTAPGIVPGGVVTAATRTGKVVGRAPLRRGVATLRIKGLPRGKSRLTVTYGGNAGIAGRTVQVPVTVR